MNRQRGTQAWASLVGAMMLGLAPLVFASDLSTVEPVMQSETGAYASRWALSTALGVPQPLSLGFQWTPDLNSRWSWTGELGWLALGLGQKRNINIWSIQTGIRYRPWQDWFEAGLNFGFRRAGVNADISNLQMDGGPLASSASLGLNAFYFSLLVGGQWHLSPRVSMGIDLGVQLSALAWGGVEILASPDTAEGTDLRVEDSDSMRRIAGLPIPQIALLRFIWYL